MAGDHDLREYTFTYRDNAQKPPKVIFTHVGEDIPTADRAFNAATGIGKLRPDGLVVGIPPHIGCSMKPLKRPDPEA